MDGFKTGYQEDFYAWTQEQAAALRAEAALRSNAPVDWENLAEEVESMGESEKREAAADEAAVSLKTFPKTPPFTLEQALDPRYPNELFPPEDD